MDLKRLEMTVETYWSGEILPSLCEYIAIPCQSPAFDPAWQSNGLLDAAAGHLASWANAQLADIGGAVVEVLKLEGCTPLIFGSIPGDGAPVPFLRPLRQAATDGRLVARQGCLDTVA